MKIPVDILSKVFRGAASEEEQQSIKSWMEASSENRSVYEQAEVLWRELGFASEPFTRDREVAWEMMASELKPKSMEERRLLGRSIVRMVILITALFAIAGVASLMLNLGRNSEVKADFRGKMVMLADGSRAYLDSGAAIRFGKTFGKRNRTVTLYGEAMLEIPYKREMPLTIRTSAGKVMANGAVVDVMAASSSAIEVVTVKGVAELTVRGQSRKIPEQGMATLDSLGVVTVIPADLNLVAWYSNRLAVNKMALGKLLKSVEKVIRKRVVLRAKVDLATPVTLVVSPVTPKSVLDSLSGRLGLSYKVEGDVVVLY